MTILALTDLRKVYIFGRLDRIITFAMTLQLWKKLVEAVVRVSFDVFSTDTSLNRPNYKFLPSKHAVVNVCVASGTTRFVCQLANAFRLCSGVAR